MDKIVSVCDEAGGCRHGRVISAEYVTIMNGAVDGKCMPKIVYK